MNKYTNIDQYIDNYPEEVQEILQKIRAIAKEIVPDGEETISYGIPTIKLNGKYVVYFAGYKDHVSLHPMLHEDPELADKILRYKSGRGTIKFPLAQPIPYDLIKQIIKSLLKENLKRTGNY